MRAGIIQDTIFRPALVTLLVLAVPLLATQLTDGVSWTPFDFVAMGVLVFGVGVAYELITKHVGRAHRLAVGGALAAAFLLVWVELAVGLFGTPFAGQ